MPPILYYRSLSSFIDVDLSPDLHIQLSTLPSNLSYNTLSIPITSHSATSPSQRQDPTLYFPRRSLFDVIAQLKAESDISPSHDPSGSTDPNCDQSHNYETLISTLESGDDLRSGVYEGGFKTWECGVDLASYLAGYLGADDRGGDGGSVTRDMDMLRWSEEVSMCDYGSADVDESANLRGEDEDDGGISGFDVIELGAGSGIPSLVLLNHVLETRMKQRQRTRVGSDPPPEGSKTLRVQHSKDTKSVRFILCDYNVEVLRLVTGANILLQLALQKNTSQTLPISLNNETVDVNGRDQSEGDLDLTPQLQQTALTILHNSNTTIDFISGAWSDAFVDLVFPPSPPPPPPPPHPSPKPTNHPIYRPTPKSRPARPVLILSSETLYSPTSLRPFVSTLLNLLRRSQHHHHHHHHHPHDRAKTSSPRSMALIASKTLYFGVGGGVDTFVDEVRKGVGLWMWWRRLGLGLVMLEREGVRIVRRGWGWGGWF